MVIYFRLFRKEAYTDLFFTVVPKDDYELLRHAFRSRDAPIHHQNQILKDYGIRWSTVNLLPNWTPVKKTALDFMHAVQDKYLCASSLCGSYVFRYRWPGLRKATIQRLYQLNSLAKSYNPSSEERKLVLIFQFIQ